VAAATHATDYRSVVTPKVGNAFVLRTIRHGLGREPSFQGMRHAIASFQLNLN
jgi:hypothetical protein